MPFKLDGRLANLFGFQFPRLSVKARMILTIIGFIALVKYHPIHLHYHYAYFIG